MMNCLYLLLALFFFDSVHSFLPVHTTLAVSPPADSSSLHLNFNKLFYQTQLLPSSNQVMIMRPALP
jgi:hypothetical protein